MTYFANQMLLAYKSKRNTAMWRLSGWLVLSHLMQTGIKRDKNSHPEDHMSTELSQQYNYVIFPCRTPLMRNKYLIRGV